MIDKRILPLALGGLAIGTTEFVIMGLLPDVAGSMGTSIPQAGHLIAAYALGVVVGAQTIIGFCSGFPPADRTVSLLLTFLCGTLSMSMIAPVNIIMMAAAQKSQMMGAAFIQAAFSLIRSVRTPAGFP